MNFPQKQNIIIGFVMSFSLVFSNCAGKTNKNNNAFYILALMGSQSYSSFAVKGSFYDSQRNPVANGTVRVVGGMDTYTDTKGNFEAFVSQPMDGNSTRVELEFLQGDVYLGNVSVPVTIDTAQEKVNVGIVGENTNSQAKSNSNFKVENIGSTGATVSKNGEFIAYYHAYGTIKGVTAKRYNKK